MTMSTDTFYWIVSICLIIITALLLIAAFLRVRVAR